MIQTVLDIVTIKYSMDMFQIEFSNSYYYYTLALMYSTFMKLWVTYMKSKNKY